MSDTKKMRFHISITDNETGEVLLDSDACAIIGGVNTGKSTIDISVVCCDTFDVVRALVTTEEVVKQNYIDHPEIGLMAMACRAGRINKTEEPKNEE